MEKTLYEQAQKELKFLRGNYYSFAQTVAGLTEAEKKKLFAEELPEKTLRNALKWTLI